MHSRSGLPQSKTAILQDCECTNWYKFYKGEKFYFHFILPFLKNTEFYQLWFQGIKEICRNLWRRAPSTFLKYGRHGNFTEFLDFFLQNSRWFSYKINHKFFKFGRLILWFYIKNSPKNRKNAILGNYRRIPGKGKINQFHGNFPQPTLAVMYSQLLMTPTKYTYLDLAKRNLPGQKFMKMA